MSRWYCIPPANFLFLLENWNTHMIIAPHVLHNETYREFYKTHPNLYTMLDNGLWEGEVLSNANLLKMANDLHVNEIVAPDDITAIKTIRKTKSFLRYLDKKDQRFKFKIHGAIHGETFAQQNNCFETFMECDIDVVDLPKMLGPDQREEWIYDINERAPDIDIHCLGYYPCELDLLESNDGFIRSFDTSVPFKLRYKAKFNLDLPNNWFNRNLIKWRLRSWKSKYYE